MTESWVAIIGDIVTPAAVIVGALWAYFTFYKERTYRPHIDVQITGRWIAAAGGLHMSVTLKNIGKAKFDLLQTGTGLMVQEPLAHQPSPPAEFQWDTLTVLPIFEKHEWIEPGESVTDELLLRLPHSPQTVQATARLVFAAPRQNVVVQARRVLDLSDPPDPDATAQEASHQPVAPLWDRILHAWGR